jgi:HK97 family phage prohead protease
MSYGIEGYASLFGIADQAGDVVERGAFAQSLRVRGAGGVRMLFQHDPAEPVGVWTAMAEDGRGLRVRGELTAGARRADDLARLIATGAIDGLSIGFRTLKAQRLQRGGARLIREIDLWEISLVTFPMLAQARLDTRAGRISPVRLSAFQR